MRAVVKSMESLQKAAEAAGYAMAAFDDEPAMAPFEPDLEVVESRAVVPYVPTPKAWSPSETLTQASTWLRAHVSPYFGGRAPA
jgi:hypothetical protein